MMMATAGGIVRCKVVFEPAILSAKNGGEWNGASYCVYFRERPRTFASTLCLGCPDRARCSSNKPPSLKLVWLWPSRK
jgi:hypothetical protein